MLHQEKRKQGRARLRFLSPCHIPPDVSCGKWINAEDAYYVVGSNMMGPMGRELIPFADQGEAMKFHQEQGGNRMNYAEISPGVLKTLGMGGMKMKHGSKHMKM